MELYLEWEKPIPLADGSAQNMIYLIPREKLPDDAGVYIFGRRKKNGHIEALYVGKATDISGRVWSHRNNLRLMKHLENAKQGQRLVRAGIFLPQRGQATEKCIKIIERALIRHFLSEGHDLVNMQGTRIPRHEIASDGRHPNQFIPKTMYVDKVKGE